MIDVTPAATQAIKAFFQEKSLDSAIRIVLQAGCGGPSLRLVLDQAKDGDESVSIEGIAYLIDKELSQASGDVKVDYLDNGHQQGFMLTAANPLPGQGGGCSCGSSCAC